MNVFPGIDRLKSQHELLTHEFKRRCHAHGLVFDYEHLKDKELYFSRTILDVKRGNRQINVNLTEQREAPSAYTKDGGLNYEIRRLVINVDDVESSAGFLWAAYQMWILDGIGEADMETFINDFGKTPLPPT